MLTDEFKEGRPKSVGISQDIDAVRKLIMQDHHVTYCEIKASLGIILDMHLEQCSSTQNSVFSGLSSDIQNDLIKSIAQVIRDEIKSEINFAKFVSVIADETPDISHREQMSVIFRYLTKTGIEERFVENPMDWDSESIAISESLLMKLEDREFCFLHTLAELFARTDITFALLQNKQSDIDVVIRVTDISEPPRRRRRLFSSESDLKRKYKRILSFLDLLSNESWIYVCGPETKQQSTVWVFQDKVNPTKVIRAKSTLKQMIAYFFEVFEEIRNNNRQRRIILHHDNASCHTSAETSRLLEGQKIELMGHMPHNPDLAPNDFYLFLSSVKNKLGG
ncbi:Mariner Mos1 transposase [Eumeta japonica]|uniref:Mariner Mos1 transposase n=1 Tax=Eumeta variegata TaxID=151549 RepID=A0A4C1YK64_EUMVA|nr:Mariner Mos1 transposase [Eumeta japonica]